VVCIGCDRRSVAHPFRMATEGVRNHADIFYFRKATVKLYRTGAKFVGSNWRRSTFCANGECAEIAKEDGLILMRSSLDPHTVIKYTTEEFRALRLGFQSGEFDDLG
jgi:hypothetical protein